MLNNIQVLRCLAALAVVWHHALAALGVGFAMPDPGLFGVAGRAGVDVFFVISGFIMVHATRDGARTPLQFWTDRIVRIAPLYWLGLALVVLLYALQLQPLGVNRIDLQDIVANLAFVPDIRADGSVYPILNVGWTLVYEMYFYLLFGLTFWMRSQTLQVASLTVLFLVSWLVLTFAGNLPHALDVYFQPITLEFAAGGVLSLLSRVDHPISRTMGRVFGYGLTTVGVIAILIASALWGDRVNADFGLRLFIWGAPSMLIVAGALILERAGAVSHNRTLLLLGAASYAIYLFHQVALQYVVQALALAGDAWPVILVAGAAAFAAAVLLGVWIHRRIEAPLTAALKTLLRTKRIQPAFAG